MTESSQKLDDRVAGRMQTLEEVRTALLTDRAGQEALMMLIGEAKRTAKVEIYI